MSAARRDLPPRAWWSCPFARFGAVAMLGEHPASGEEAGKGEEDAEPARYSRQHRMEAGGARRQTADASRPEELGCESSNSAVRGAAKSPRSETPAPWSRPPASRSSWLRTSCLSSIWRHGAAPKLDRPASRRAARGCPLPQQQPAAPTSLSTLQRLPRGLRPPANFTLRPTSCPIYSGHGFDKNRRATRRCRRSKRRSPDAAAAACRSRLPLADVARGGTRGTPPSRPTASFSASSTPTRCCCRGGSTRQASGRRGSSQAAADGVGAHGASCAATCSATGQRGGDGGGGDGHFRAARSDGFRRGVVAEVAEAHRSLSVRFSQHLPGPTRGGDAGGFRLPPLHKLLSGLLSRGTLRDGRRHQPSPRRRPRTYVGGRVEPVGVEAVPHAAQSAAPA